jgi:two-component system, sensor histidine kinase and response regulator
MEQAEMISCSNCIGRILIVEDEEDLALLLQYNLNKADYETVVADNGRKALDLVEKILPDVILLDILLPEMSGWEVCRHIRAHPKEEVASIPIILLTALREDQEKYRGLELGADVFIKKPYALQEVLLHCRNLVHNRQRHLRLIRARDSALDEQKEDFYGILFHELRNQLIVISGMTTFLGRKTTNAKERKYIQAIQRSVEYLETIAGEISNLEQICRQKNIFPQDAISLKELLIEVLALISPLARKKNIGIQLMSRNNTLQFRQCKTAVKIILVVLLENALKYSPPDSAVKISLARSDDNLQVAVTDHGPGIEIEEQFRIFDKAYRARQARNTFVGTGMGLYIAKKLADSMNSTISVQSRPGKGSTFTCTFPIHDDRVKDGQA